MRYDTLDENGYTRLEIDCDATSDDDPHIRIEPLKEYRLTEEWTKRLKREGKI